MEALKKNWIIILITLATILLAFFAILTGVKLRQIKPVAPTVPQATPRAEVGPTPNPACRLSFNILASPSPSPSPSPSVSPSPSPRTSPSPSPSPTPGVSPSPSVSPTPPSILGCYRECASDSDCDSSLRCQTVSGTKRCINISCTNESDCVCNKACWEVCGTDSECPSNLKCQQIDNLKRCLNPSCGREQDCLCTHAAASPSPASPSATPQVQVPVTPQVATVWPTILVILGGIFLLGLGIAL